MQPGERNLLESHHHDRLISAKQPARAANCSAVCPAVTLSRTSDSPAGTDGGRMPGAQIPRSRSSSANRMARSGSPTTSGMIWLVESPIFQPSACRRGAQIGRLGQQLLAAPRLGGHDVERRRGRGAGGRRMGGRKDVGPGPIGQPIDQQCAAGDKSAARAERLAQGADADVNVLGQVELFDQSAAAAAEHAGGMGFVDQQHGIEARGQLRQVRQRSDVAIHAEQRVGHDQFPAAVCRPPASISSSAWQSPCG